MADKFYTVLEDRGVLSISGEDRNAFLQGLISNDIEKTSPERAIYAAFLTAQGKYLHDFFIAEAADDLLLDCEGTRLEDLKKRLTMYKMRSQVEVVDKTPELAVVAFFGDGVDTAPEIEGVTYMDPRLAAAGARAMMPKDTAEKTLQDAGFTAAPFDDYDQWRIRLGLADSSRDMEVKKALLLENGFDELGGADWDKGCYLGQELTARTKYRGLVKKRLVPVTIDGTPPPAGTPVTMDGKDAGEMRSSSGTIGLALLRLKAMEKGGDLLCEDAKLTPNKPDWMIF